MTIIEVPFSKLPKLFARITGRNGKSREYQALLSPGSEVSILPRVDAYHLGYSEVLQDATTSDITRPENWTTLVSYSSYLNAPTVIIKNVSLGPLDFNEVEFAAHDLPGETGFDLVIGHSLLKHTTTNIDYKRKLLTLGK